MSFSTVRSNPIFPDPERASFGVNGKIIYLQMEDHYVRVHTELGSTLILMRFGDAIRELGETAGARVHRSLWVAYDAVCSMSLAGWNMRLDLVNGLMMPVSQSYLSMASALVPVRPLFQVG